MLSTIKIFDKKRSSRFVFAFFNFFLTRSLRGGIWRTIAGYHEFVQKRPDAYSDARKEVFGEKVPKYILRGNFKSLFTLLVPTFGGSFRPQDHYLNEHGTEAAKRILCVLAMENPGIEYLPVIPDLGSPFLFDNV